MFPVLGHRFPAFRKDREPETDDDAINAVPRALREAAYGLGATKLEVSLKVVLPAALSGIAAAVIVGISRAVGETMIVALAAGAGDRHRPPPRPACSR